MNTNFLKLFNNKNKASLLQRLLMVNSILIITLLLIMFGFVFVKEYVSSINRQMDTLSSLAVIISDRLTGVIVFNDYELARKNIVSLKNSDDIQTACLYDSEIMLISKFNQKEEVFCSQSQYKTTALTIDQPIKAEGEIIGHLVLYANTDKITQQLFMMFIYLLFITVICFAVFWRMSKWILTNELQPVAMLADTAQKIANTGAYDLRVNVSAQSTKELSNLVDSFNQLLEIVERHNLELESKITERTKQLESEKQKVEQSSQAKSEFLARLSHDLRTPLTSILGYTELIGENDDTYNRHRTQLDSISRNVEFTNTLITDLLMLAKIESGYVQLDRTIFDLNELITSMEDIFRPLATKKDLELVIKTREIRNSHLSGDIVKLKQILNNLLENAIKNTSDGRVELLITQTRHSKHKSEFEFKITDTGHGIQNEDIEKIFDDYVQINSSITARHGSGLGLSITKKYTELMHGNIQVDSRPGQGSTFSIRIPFENAILNDKQIVEIPAATIREFFKEKASILIIDDDFECQTILMNILSPYCNHILQAFSIGQAKQLLAEYKPKLIFLDIELPDGSGLGYASCLQADANQIIIAISAHINVDDSKISTSRIDKFIGKPFSKEDIITALKILQDEKVNRHAQ